MRDGWARISTRRGITFRLEVRDGIVVEAAPVARRCIGKPFAQALAMWMPCDMQAYPATSSSQEQPLSPARPSRPKTTSNLGSPP
jgi:hypothetical protein